MSDLADVDVDQYVRSENVAYIEVENEISDIETHLEIGANLIQKGPKGIGKTISFESVARDREIPYIAFDCSKDTKRKHLISKSTIGTDDSGKRQVENIPGALIKAIMAANQRGTAMLVLEEINSLSPNMQKLVNSAADTTGEIDVPEAGTVVRLHENARLMIGGTMNPSSITGGTFELNDDLRSRFSEIQRDFPDNDQMQEILRVNGVPQRIGDVSTVRREIAAFVHSMHGLSDSGEVQYEFSPRDAVRLGRMWQQYYNTLQNDGRSYNRDLEREALRRALPPCALDKYPTTEEQRLVRDEVQDSFAVTL